MLAVALARRQHDLALLALLILKCLHYLSRAGWSLSNLAALLPLNLFTYRALIAWLDDRTGRRP